MTAKSTTSELRIRNTGLRRVRVADLADAPWNHRTHPQAQQEALDGAIDELGFYGFPDVYEADGGVLMLIDGHLRKERLIAKYGADAEIEVNVTDFDEHEAKLANLTKDPLAAMAEENAVQLDALLRDCQTGSAALSGMLERMAKEAGIVPLGGGGGTSESGGNYTEQYGVIVICDGEAQQKGVYEKLAAEGYNCKVVVT